MRRVVNKQVDIPYTIQISGLSADLYFFNLSKWYACSIRKTKAHCKKTYGSGNINIDINDMIHGKISISVNPARVWDGYFHSPDEEIYQIDSILEKIANLIIKELSP